MKRVTWGPIQNPIRGLLHGVAAVGSLVGAIVLLRSAALHGARTVVGVAIFSVALFSMYLTSTLYHSVPWSAARKRFVQKLDHSMIFLVVAGTFTPVALAALDGTQLWVALGLVWLIAVIGILIKALQPSTGTGLSVGLQLAMGWSALLWLQPIWQKLGSGAVALIVAGGLAYLIGVLVFALKRPRLLVRSFGYHELFHVLVVTGSALHFVAILNYAVPAVS